MVLMERELEAVVAFTIAFLTMCVIGKILNRVPGKYVIIHSLANICVAVLSYEDAMQVLLKPSEAMEHRARVEPLAIVVAIHAYHVCFFRITDADVLHHVVMVIGTVPANAFYDCGLLVNLCSFSICGAPGAICYFAIALRKNSIITRTCEKRVNAAVNTWFRTPLITITAYVIFMITQDSHMNYQMLVAFLVFWNGQYYGRQVVENYGAHVGRLDNAPRTPPPKAC